MQLWVLEQLLSVVRNPRLPRSESWLISISRFLLLHSYFSVAAQMEQVSVVLRSERVAQHTYLYVYARTMYVYAYSSHAMEGGSTNFHEKW